MTAWAPRRGPRGVRHFLEIDDLDREELEAVLTLAAESALPQVLEGRGVALLFEHPSLRTRHATEVAVSELGGHPVSAVGAEVGLGVREPAADVARVLAGYHAVIGARVRRHGTLVEMAAALDGAGQPVPVVNLLSDAGHPAQVLADLLVLRRHLGELAGRRLTYVGDANNVCRSLVLAGALTGLQVTVAAPAGFGLSEELVERAGQLGAAPVCLDDPHEAAAGADALYTDVWTSMGQEAENARRRQAFAGFTLDGSVLAAAAPGAIVLHCLPAHRGEEISEDVLEGTASVVFEQAALRMAAMVGLLAWLGGVEPR